MIKGKFFKGCLLYFILVIIGMIMSTILILDKIEDFVGTTEDNIRYYTLREFEGKVTRKFINKEDHANNTLTLEFKENNVFIRKNEAFIFDHSGFYDYVKVGDSLVKKEGDLFATVYREGAKDTVIHFKFKNYETGEVFPKEK